MSKILIIGSSNTDLVVKTSHIPEPGETTLGDNFMMAAGGKGANQAVAASRLGGDVAFIACVGNDMYGKQSIENYKKEKMDISHIRMDEKAPSGVALISVADDGENSIVVASGANYALCKADIDAADGLFREADYILMQLEIPMPVIEYAAALGKKYGKKVIINPAPAAPLSDSLLKGLYLITPNKTECRQLTGIDIQSDADLDSAAECLMAKGVENVVITLGSKGSYVRTPSGSSVVPTMKVKAMDTTGAGDTYNGALLVALSEGQPLEKAVGFASKAAAISVTRMGAQPSIPWRKEMDN